MWEGRGPSWELGSKMVCILGIETSCDETAAAIIEDGRRIASSVVASQVDLHAQYGGVFPEMASRAHIEAIAVVVQRALDAAGVGYGNLDAVAVTRGPGLPGSLLVGVNFAKGLAIGTGLPLIGVNHLEGHIYALWLVEDAPEPRFPAVALIVSGGHTSLVLMTDHGQYQQLGQTLDDAAGEAFDKVGRVLGLPYPGGPAIERAAREGDARAYRFPVAEPDGAFDFSFSGLKTAVLREIKTSPGHRVSRETKLRADVNVADVAASFQAAVVDALLIKTAAAARTYRAENVLLVGGVSANKALREAMQERLDVPVLIPPLALCTDNAAMIGAAGHFRYLAGQRDTLDMDIQPLWPLDS
ncbi:MAG: tRNA (adenosine(37)-N6)-threonylcarbamoyltransferase complex transferase subunit TsaD [Anaerolineae bacterium]